MGVKRMQRAKLAAAYLLLALAAALGWLYSCLPDRVYLEPGQALYLPRFAWVEPQRGHGSRNVASTRAVGSYQTTLTLGGLCCVLPDFRRHGLFGALMGRAIGAGDLRSSGRMLSAGRMAHPGAFRLMAVRPSVVPKPGIPPTPWQQEVGQAVADVYGVESFDPETFVCVGSGKPIGYPVIELVAEEHEWEVFEPVDRDRGDALLGIAWNPDPPEGW